MRCQVAHRRRFPSQVAASPWQTAASRAAALLWRSLPKTLPSSRILPTLVAWQRARRSSSPPFCAPVSMSPHWQTCRAAPVRCRRACRPSLQTLLRVCLQQAVDHAKLTVENAAFVVVHSSALL